MKRMSSHDRSCSSAPSAWARPLRLALLFLTLLGGPVVVPAPARAENPSVPAFRTVEIPRPESESDAAVLGRPVFIAYDRRSLYVVDALDCAVKIFSKDGRFESAAGRKGNGPGELSFPSGVSVADGRLYVADKLNHRIQVIDRNGGPLGGFPVPFAPDKVHVLGEGRILVSRDAAGRPGPAKLLSLFDEKGRVLWEALEARSSGDPVFDAFLNMILVNPGPRGGFTVVFKSQERVIYRWGGPQGPPVLIPVDARYGDKPLVLPLKGKENVLRGFCWASAFDQEGLYLLAPEYTPERDLGPGRRIYRIEGSGRLSSTIDLPFPVSRFAVEDDHIYALDTDGELRILRVVR